MENTNVQNETCTNNCCHGCRWWLLYKIRSILVIILLLFAIAHLARGFFGHSMMRGGDKWSCMMAGMRSDHKMDMKWEKWCGCVMSWCMMNKMMWDKDDKNMIMTGSNMKGN